MDKSGQIFQPFCRQSSARLAQRIKDADRRIFAVLTGIERFAFNRGIINFARVNFIRQSRRLVARKGQQFFHACFIDHRRGKPAVRLSIFRDHRRLLAALRAQNRHIAERYSAQRQLFGDLPLHLFPNA